MKKFVFNLMHFGVLILILSIVCSCKSDSDSDTKPEASWWDAIPEKIVGDWVYDNSKENTWEIMSFSKTGVFTFSTDSYWDIVNENVNGRYFVNEDKVTGSYYRDGIVQNLDLVIKSINNYDFTAKFNDTGLTFTYSKRISTKDMKTGEAISPDYEYDLWHSLNGNATKDDAGKIYRYTSHNTRVATVDANTGEITAVGGGRTYIDVVTDKGTAVVEVNVEETEEPKYFMAYDYTQFIGATKQTVTDTFEFLYTTDGDWITYNYLDGSEAQKAGLIKDKNWKAIMFLFDHDTEKVIAVGMQARDDVWFTNEEMTTYLSSQYYVYEKGTEENYKAFINAVKFDDATVGITWDYENKALTFTKITHNSQTPAESIEDFSIYMGKNHDEIYEMMGEKKPFTTSDERIVYNIDSKYVKDVYFEFERKDGSSKVLKNTVQQITVHLSSDATEEIVKQEIEKYFIYKEGIANSFSNYISMDGNIALTYNFSWSSSSSLIYSWINAPDDDTSDVKIDYSYLLGKTNAEAKEAMNGITPSTDTEETLIFRLNDDYVSAVVCYFKNTKNELKDVIQKVQVRLQNGIDQEVIKTEIAKKYQFYDETAGNLFYYNEDYSLTVVFSLEYNMIEYRQR